MAVYETLSVEIAGALATIKLNRSACANAINAQMLVDLKTVIRDLEMTASVRVIILNASGKVFCAGIDFAFLKEILAKYHSAEGEVREALRQFILDFQAAFNAFETCRKPIIATVAGACIGGGLDMIAACDLRFCSEAAFFSIKEIDLSIVADLGSLQRLPHLINRGTLTELAFTGKNFTGQEAANFGLVNRCFQTTEQMQDYVTKLGTEIAGKAPLAIRGIKQMLLYSRDHSVADALTYAATWNSAMLISKDHVI